LIQPSEKLQKIVKLQTSDKQKADIENVEGNLPKQGKQSRFKQRWQPCNVKSP